MATRTVEIPAGSYWGTNFQRIDRAHNGKFRLEANESRGMVFCFFNTMDQHLLLTGVTENYQHSIISYINSYGNIVREKLIDKVTIVKLSPEGNRIALPSGEIGDPSQIEIENLDGTTISHFTSAYSGVADSFSQTGQYLILTYQWNRISVYQADPGDFVKSIIPPGNGVHPTCSTAFDENTKELYVILQDSPTSGQRFLEIYKIGEHGFDPIWSYPLGSFDIQNSPLDNRTMLSFSGDMNQMTAINGSRQFVLQR